jgi:hypothetical protein
MRLSTVIWSVLGLTLLVIGGSRIQAGLGDRETQIERQMAAMVESVQETGGEGLRRYVSRQYLDEDTGLDYRGLRSALREGPEDLVLEFDPSTGIEFLSTDSEGDDVICTIRVRCLLRKRALGQAPQPYWDLEAELDLRLRRGTWKVLRSREVNHSDRGRA